MKQLTQKLKNGNMEIKEVPYPNHSDNQILVRTMYSVISAGTEGRSVKDARANYIGKAKARPNEVKQVLNTIKTQGLLGTYRIVMDKLNSLSYLGYCCAGEVISVGKNIKKFKVGDLVACGGQGAAHAEVVSVLENLCVKIPEGVDIKHASFSTIGSIVMQGIRQADNRLGENCLVIGLGLLGQFTIQILNSAGINTIGVDLDENKIELAKNNGCSLAITRDDPSIIEKIIDFTDGYGVDSSIITAATNSNDPINLAGEACKMKGTVVSVGRVSTDFNRDIYYKKELDLKMSCSYGPGRYDSNYEEKGIDYPYGYVRWTENRNMKAYINLLKQSKLNIDSLITHVFDFSEAISAYDMIMDKKESHIGILLEYDHKKELKKYFKNNNANTSKSSLINIGFIGAGSFAKSLLLPNLPNDVNKTAVATASSHNARDVVDKFNFQYAFSSGDEIIDHKDINTIFITTRHNTHFNFVLKSIKKGKHVFVEKPLCMNEEELDQIMDCHSTSKQHLMVGYNRRFSPQIRKIIDTFGKDSKKTINYRINVGPVDPKHWTQDKDIGGGRVIGEVCHFLDLCMFLAGSKPKSIAALCLEDPLNLEDTITSIVQFQNGSVATISYYTNGNKMLEKEYLEVYCNGSIAIMNDFKKLTILGEKKIHNTITQDKGHRQELVEFFNALKNNTQMPISSDELYWSSKMSFDLIKSIRDKKIINY